MTRALGAIALVALGAGSCSCDDAAPPAATPATPTYGYTAVNIYPHDRAAFTQGLAYDGTRLYEGTGGYGSSTLREVDLESGAVLRSRPLASQYFGEGIALVDTQIVQLTWRSNVGFVYGAASFESTRTFAYASEGWGIACDNTSPARADGGAAMRDRQRTRLVMSDGTPRLRFLDATTFATTDSVDVRTVEGTLVSGLNELEFVRGEIYANVWLTDRVAIITPETGRVRAWIDLSGLLTAEDRTPRVDVLNGIAYDEATDRLFVTGKLWPKLFEIEIVGAN
ncbi:MAG: glutaminyl-peptide cyclotransferase [bacterium]